jgi:hypothetical protein
MLIGLSFLALRTLQSNFIVCLFNNDGHHVYWNKQVAIQRNTIGTWSFVSASNISQLRTTMHNLLPAKNANQSERFDMQLKAQ